MGRKSCWASLFTSDFNHTELIMAPKKKRTKVGSACKRCRHQKLKVGPWMDRYFLQIARR